MGYAFVVLIIFIQGDNQMPAALSIDLRKRIMAAYNGGKPVKEIAEQFYVGQDSIYKLIRHVKETGSINPKPLNNGRKPKVNTSHLEAIKQKLIAQPNITLAKLIAELNLPVGQSALSKIIRHKLNIPLRRYRRF